MALGLAPVNSATAVGSVSRSTTEIVLVPHVVLKGKKKLSVVGLTVEIQPVVPGRAVPTGQVTFAFIDERRKKIAVKALGTAELTGGEVALTFKPSQVLN